MKNNKPKVSVIIPAYNEEKLIFFCLQSLANQKGILDYEVIVVDNNSTDKTRQVALQFKDKLNLRVITEKKQGRGSARATGFNQALGEILVSTDADVKIHPGWLEGLVSHVNQGYIAATSSCKIEDCTKMTRFLVNRLQPPLMVFYRLLVGHYWLSGYGFAIHRDVYHKVGGFNPNLQSMEDIDISFRVSKLGKIKFVNNPITFSGRRLEKGIMRGFWQYAKSFYRGFILKRQDVYLSNIR